MIPLWSCRASALWPHVCLRKQQLSVGLSMAPGPPASIPPSQSPPGPVPSPFCPPPNPRLPDEPQPRCPAREGLVGVWSPTDPQFRARCPRPRGPEDRPPQGAASPAQSPGPPPPPSQPSPAWALIASRAAVSLLQSGLFTASAREAHRLGAEVTSAACSWQELRTRCFSCPRLPQPGPSQEGAQHPPAWAPARKAPSAWGTSLLDPAPRGCGPPLTKEAPHPAPA